VHRAEIRAAEHCFEAFGEHRMQLLDNISIHIDNANVLKGIQRVTQGWTPGPDTPDGDLWGGIHTHTPKNLKKENFLNIDSHLSKEEAIGKGFTYQGWNANNVADGLAEEGARRNQFWGPDIEIQQKIDQVTERVLKRMIKVHRLILEEQDTHQNKRDAANKLSKLTRRKEVEGIGKDHGHKLVITDKVQCSQCHQKSGITKCWRWIHQPCQASHQHTLQTLHGLTFCQKCGHWDAKGGKGSRGLKGPCRPNEVPPFRRKSLQRLLLKDPQPPCGKGWPDGTPWGIRKRKREDNKEEAQSGPPPGPANAENKGFRPLNRLAEIRERIRAKELLRGDRSV